MEKNLVMNAFNLHPQIEADSTFITNLNLCQVRLHNNAAFPWLMLIPNTNQIEIVDLSPQDQQTLMNEICQASSVMRQLYSPTKLNIASIGNAVSQIHVHVVARYNTDKAWPRPVWYCGVDEEYALSEKEKHIHSIKEAFNSF